jgi:hypothetical protein
MQAAYFDNSILEYQKPEEIWFNVNRSAGTFFWILRKGKRLSRKPVSKCSLVRAKKDKKNNTSLIDEIADYGYICVKPRAFETICKNQLSLFQEILTLLNELKLLSKKEIKELLEFEKNCAGSGFRGNPSPFKQLNNVTNLLRQHVRILREGIAQPTKTEIRARIIVKQLIIEKNACFKVQPGEKYCLTSSDVRQCILGPINRRDTIAAMKRAAEIFPEATFLIVKGSDNRNHAILAGYR